MAIDARELLTPRMACSKVLELGIVACGAVQPIVGRLQAETSQSMQVRIEGQIGIAKARVRVLVTGGAACFQGKPEATRGARTKGQAVGGIMAVEAVPHLRPAAAGSLPL